MSKGALDDEGNVTIPENVTNNITNFNSSAFCTAAALSTRIDRLDLVLEICYRNLSGSFETFSAELTMLLRCSQKLSSLKW